MMLERFSPEARRIIVIAQDQARRLGHRWIGCEHLLLALARVDGETGALVREEGVTPQRVEAEIARMIGHGADGTATVLDTLDRDALASVGIDLDAVRDKIEATLGPDALKPRVRPRAARRPPWRRRLPHPDATPTGHLPFTRRAKQCLAAAVHEAKAEHSGTIGAEHLAVALVSMKDGMVPPVLSALGVSAARLRTLLLDTYRQAG